MRPSAAKRPAPTAAATAKPIVARPAAASPRAAVPAYLQRKLQLGRSDDPREVEADRVADEVAAKPATARAEEPIVRRSGDTSVVQRPASTSGGSEVSADLQDRIQRERGRGAALPPATQSAMEARFHADFSGVSVHTDADSAALAASLDARAFTVGHDIWFAPGQYAPETDAGGRLLAHELTHVVQQGGEQTIRRAGAEKSPGTAKAPSTPKKITGEVKDGVFAGDGYSITRDHKNIVIPKLAIPGFKEKFFEGKKLELSTKRREEAKTRQRQKWDSGVREGVKKSLEAKVGASRPEGASSGAQQAAAVYAFRAKGQVYIGTISELVRRSTRPGWDKDGAEMSFQVDHQQEFVLGGPDELSNFWLLTGSKNGLSGRIIQSSIVMHLDALLKAASEEGLWTQAPKYEEIRYGDDKNIAVTGLAPVDPMTLADNETYTREEIEGGRQFESVKFLTDAEMSESGLLGTEDRWNLFSTATGGFQTTMTRSGSTWRIDGAPQWLRGVEVEKVGGESGSPDSLHLRVFGSRSAPNRIMDPTSVVVPLKPMRKGWFARYLTVETLGALLSKQGVEGWSPIEFDEPEFTADGLSMHGVITVTAPLLTGSTIDVYITGNSITVEKTFSTDEVKIPGPVRIDGLDLTLSAGTAGLAAKGGVDFAIDRIGSGRVQCTAATNEGGTVALTGSFALDPSLVDESAIVISYAEGKVSGSGRIGIRAGRIRGIRSAKLAVAVDGEKWSAEGEIVPELPGIERGKFTLAFDPAKGLSGSGEFSLKPLPGIRGGMLRASMENDGGRTRLKAGGDIELAVPGLPASIHADYDDGDFVATLKATYARGPMSGTLLIGVTNNAAAGDGAAAGGGSSARAGGDKDAPAAARGGATNALHLFGSGQLTVRLSPWLQGTVGATLTPDGRLRLLGEIAVPEDLELFSAIRFDRQLVDVHFDIPIVGVAFAGQRIGIFATVGGGLQLVAGIGPGRLQKTRVHIDYTPGEENRTHVTGAAELHVPADAGLRLSIRGGIGAGIPIVSAEAVLEIGAFAGVAAEGTVGLVIDWRPNRGLRADSVAAVKAAPTFAFDVVGHARVLAGAFGHEMELFDRSWDLKHFTFGSGLELGVELPVHYVEGTPFRPSFDDAKWTYPTVDVPNMITGLMKRVVE